MVVVTKFLLIIPVLYLSIREIMRSKPGLLFRIHYILEASQCAKQHLTSSLQWGLKFNDSSLSVQQLPPHKQNWIFCFRRGYSFTQANCLQSCGALTGLERYCLYSRIAKQVHGGKSLIPCIHQGAYFSITLLVTTEREK